VATGSTRFFAFISSKLMPDSGTLHRIVIRVNVRPSASRKAHTDPQEAGEFDRGEARAETRGR
jgi:hypothetical protein